MYYLVKKGQIIGWGDLNTMVRKKRKFGGEIKKDNRVRREENE